MESPERSVKDLFEKTEQYSQTTLKWLKLTVLDISVTVLTTIYSRIISGIFLGMSVLVFTIGAALFLGDFFVKSYYGFFVVAGFYFLVGIICHFFLHKWIKKTMSESLIKKALQ